MKTLFCLGLAILAFYALEPAKTARTGRHIAHEVGPALHAAVSDALDRVEGVLR